MTSVLIASESDLIRRGLEALVAASPSLEMAGSLARLSELGPFLQDDAPDVAVVAVGPDFGLEELFRMASHAAREAWPGQPAYVVLGSRLASDIRPDQWRAGIRALLPPEAAGEEILAAIHAVRVGLIVLHPAMMGATHGDASPRHPPQEGRASHLTGRELEVLAMLAEGLGNKEIAWRLRISEHTVKFHISSIFTKLEASSRAEAVSLGFRLGLILI